MSKLSVEIVNNSDPLLDDLLDKDVLTDEQYTVVSD